MLPSPKKALIDTSTPSPAKTNLVQLSARDTIRRFSARTLAGVALFLVVGVIASSAQTLTTLVDFNGTNGTTPYAPPIQGRDGNFYGISGGGGANAGTVFKVTPEGVLTTLHQFSFTDGAYPVAPLVLGVDGNLYGTTRSGGSGADGGTVFRITPTGQLTILYQFCSLSNCADGEYVDAGLIQGPDGNFYGATYAGGANSAGTIYKITRTGKLTTLYSFCALANCADGQQPFETLTLGTNGLLYGTTGNGGTNGQGTLFEISLSGKLTTLYNFKGFVHGPSPFPSTLTQASDGSFYGTTYDGGSKSYGSVFRFSQHGGFKTLYTFCSQSNCPDGENPQGGVVQGSDGNFYGTTEFGGHGAGTIFQITPAGELTTIYNFCSQSSCLDGDISMAGLSQGTDGSFYGSTIYGGTVQFDGTIFSFSNGLSPFVQASPNFGKVSSSIVILGNNLTGTTGVTFNGTPATFQVVSGSYIKAVVPSGATAGTIQVTTPTGSLSSAVEFQILP